MKKSLILFVCLISTSMISTAFAHQPRLIVDQANTIDTPIIIEEPEISKAYYAQLKKLNQYYEIDSAKEFDLYLSLQVPDIPMQSTNISLELKDNSGLQLSYMNGSKHLWDKFHENFGNANYLSGPSIHMILPSGKYFIIVSGEENTKYVLVSGQKEEFPLSEFLNSLFLVPKINQEYFDMSIVQSLANIFGLLLIMIFSVIGFVILIVTKRFLKPIVKKT